MIARVLALVALATAVAPAAPGNVVRVEHHDPTALPSRGPASAAVTIELFFTPGQGSRISGYRLLENLAAAHPSRIRLVYRLLKGQARLPYAALEAHAQGKFFEFMEAVNKARYASFSDLQLLDLAKGVGLDTERLAIAMKNPPAAYDHVLDVNLRRLRQRVHGLSSPVALFNGKPLKGNLSSLQAADLERMYNEAYADAQDLLDRGADSSTLVDASDDEQRPKGWDPIELQVTAGAVDEGTDDIPAEPPLATPPLKLAGMPARGSAGADVTIAVLCSPTSTNCRDALHAAELAQDTYPDAVRVVWAPYFDVSRDDAADLALLADAALCAEKVGTGGDDSDTVTSPGWRWVKQMLSETSIRHRRISVDQLIDKVADRLAVDTRAFAACRAQVAGTTIQWIESARHAGVRTTPSTVVGGRIYPSIIDANLLQQLIDNELAPGVLGWAAPAWRRP